MPLPAAAVVSSALPVVEKGFQQVSKILDDRIIEHRVVRRRKNKTVETTVGLNGWHLVGAGAFILAGFAIGAFEWKRHTFEYYDYKTNTKKLGMIALPCASSKGNEKYGIRIGFNPVTGILPIPVFTP